MIGNSSSAIREGSFIGVPAVNVGTRQNGRQRGKNVIDVDYKGEEIIEAVKKQIKNAKYESEHIYGDGSAGKKIADVLSTCKIKVQKRLAY
jgi:UDP-N-acetylglucosamine 2-epimerase